MCGAYCWKHFRPEVSIFLIQTNMKQKNRLRALLLVTGFVFSAVFSPSYLKIVRAAAPGQVVINEVAWAGSLDSSTDEWIELYNNFDQAVDVTNWHISDDLGASDYVILSGSIPAHGYFLIEDHEAAVMNVPADAIIDLSLANTGDSLQLYDAGGQLIDTVNGSGGAWYAGDATSRATMERIDPVSSVDAASNWASSTGSGSQSSGGSAMVATPKALNSQTSGGQGGGQQIVSVDLTSDSVTPHVGDVLTVTSSVNDVQNLFAYGFELTYDPSVLHYKNSGEKAFLGENGVVATSFQANLQNSQEGTVLVAGARTVQPKTGVSGSGELFELQFDVIGSGTTIFQPGVGTFLASPSADIPTQFNGVSVSSSVVQIAPVTNLSAVPGTERYSIQLAWDAVAGAEKYRVYRKDAHGQQQLIGETVQPGFVDADGVQSAGFIVPANDYGYAVIAVQGAVESAPAEVIGRDDRGLKGDNNRSDRVDGRDLEALARHFSDTDADSGFDPLVDTTYDGRVDGSDLIDLGANFAQIYQL